MWHSPQTHCYMSISSDLWTTSSFNTSSPQHRYRHNPWPKGRQQDRVHLRLNLLHSWHIVIVGNVLQCLFEPGCSPAPTRRMPDASWWYLLPPRWLYRQQSWAHCTVCWDYRGHKATVQLSPVLPVQLSVPWGWPSPPGSPLPPPPPTPLYFQQLKGDIYQTGR